MASGSLKFAERVGADAVVNIRDNHTGSLGVE